MTRKSILLALASLCAAALSLLAGCPAPGALDSAAADPNAAGRAIPDTVYIAGRCLDRMSNSTACYWRGTTSRVDLNGHVAASVYVSAGTVYTAGSYYTGVNLAPCYWVGTSRVVLPMDAAATSGYATSIFVAGGTVFVAGYYGSGSSYRACVWKIDSEGVLNRITLPATAGRESYAYSIYVDKSIGYVAGFNYNSSGRSIARLWLLIGSGVRSVNLSSNHSVAYGVFAYGGSAYLGGYYNAGAGDVACYWTWKGSSAGATVSLTRTDLPGADARVNSLTVYTGSNKVIAAGSVGQRACYWLNGTRVDFLPAVSSAALSVCLQVATIYKAGRYFDGSYDQACVWDNRSTLFDLPDKGYGSMACGIF